MTTHAAIFSFSLRSLISNKIAKEESKNVTLKTSKLRRNVCTEAIQIKYGRMSFGNKYISVCIFCVPEFLLAFHFGNLVSDGLFEVIVTRDFTCDNRKLLPVISH